MLEITASDMHVLGFVYVGFIVVVSMTIISVTEYVRVKRRNNKISRRLDEICNRSIRHIR